MMPGAEIGRSVTPDEVLDFWFAGEPTVSRKAWFVKDAAFDLSCGRFREALRAAREGAFDAWTATPHGSLALLILLDQFSRNLHRGSPEAFAADSKARQVARDAVSRGFDRNLTPVERMFLYLPFEHSESLPDQEISVNLFETLRETLGSDAIGYAHRHRDVIRRFGRFPHRNAVLGRISTPEEQSYLSEPGAGF
jgi:uncharacterized protein (DUF924 family)